VSFTTPAFFCLLAVFLGAWPFLRQGARSRYFAISAASLVFYGWWDWRFLGLLLGTGTLDFAAALLMVRLPRLRKSILWVSIAANLGAICFFKYLGFGLEQLGVVFDIPSAAHDWAHQIVLPVGISFYTFASMSYTIDVYRGQLKPVRDPLQFCAFLSMFPHLVAGPIVRGSELLPQLETPGHFSRANRLSGLQRVTWGFVKKVVVADHLAPVVNEYFAASSDLGLGWWVVVVLFAIQIFCDFSGYCDIASGIVQWMGYRFPENFLQPYAAIGFRDFWSRWHITLSSWFRDYLYVPLGGSRRGGVRTTVNLMATMLLSGLWHGASWTFVAWGVFHALLLIAERFVMARGTRVNVTSFWWWPTRLALWLLTFACVCVGWALFRSSGMEQARHVTGSMMGLSGWGELPPCFELPSVWLSLGIIVLASGFWLISSRRSTHRLESLPSWLRVALIVLGLLSAVFVRGPGSDFIYFQF
jgi:alginate O-acetyltransferase complex protein AlgI